MGLAVTLLHRAGPRRFLQITVGNLSSTKRGPPPSIDTPTPTSGAPGTDRSHPLGAWRLLLEEKDPLRAAVDRIARPSRPGRHPVERRIAAVLGLDVVGYSLQMGSDDEGTHRRIGRALARV